MSNYEIAGKGSYGIVIKPALPNINNTGQNIHFPKNVAKIFINHNSYNKTIKNTQIMKNSISELHINAIPYTKIYKVSNLPEKIKQTIKNYFISETGEDITDDTQLDILRTPYLGISIGDMNKKGLYTQLREINYKEICLQMYKCMNVVKAITRAGYIHGDIRETNVLFNLSNATITIIDFDWLKPFIRFFNQYPTFFYPHPPECLFIFGRKIRLKNKGITIGSLIDKDDSIISEDEFAELYNSVKTSYDFYDSEQAAKGIIEIENIFKNRMMPNNIFSIAKEFIDSYSLGYTFHQLLYKAWYINTSIHNSIGSSLQDIPINTTIGGITKNQKNGSDYKNFLKIREFIALELIPRLAHSNYKKRWNINTAITKFKYKLLEIGIDVPSTNEEKEMIENELRRMELLGMNYSHMTNDGAPVPKNIPSTNQIHNTFNTIIESKIKGGRRKTRKNRNK